MKHILYLTAEFAPVQTTGARRPIRFVEGLLNRGHKVTVLTLDSYSAKLNFPFALVSGKNKFDSRTNYSEIRLSLDPSYYINTWKNRLFFYFILNQDKVHKAWEKGIRKFVDQHKQNDFDCIICNIPPFSIALSALQISKRLKVPLITDFRDHWAHWGCTPYASKMNYLKVKGYERKVIINSDKVLGVTKQLLQDLQNFHAISDEDKFIHIPNGFDELEDLPNKLLYNFPFERKIKIGYVGAYYYSPEAHSALFSKWYQRRGHRKFQYTPRKENYKYRSPFYFFKAIKRLISVYPEMKGKLEIVLIGDVPDWLRPMVKEFDIEEMVVMEGRLPKTDTDLKAMQFDWVLTTSIKIDGGKDYCLASKSFDYLKWKKPTLAFVCEGEQKDFVEASNCGKVFNPDEDSSEELYETLMNSQEFKLNKSYLNDFSIENTISKLEHEIVYISN